MGKLISVDGLDASGKKTQCNLLYNYLAVQNKNVRLIDFPRYKTKGATFVEEYLSGKLGGRPEDTNAYAASLFFALDRYYSYVTEWKDFYNESDSILIADRFTSANAVHQLTKLPRSEWDYFLEWLYAEEYERLGIPKPDKVIYLELLPEISINLLNQREKEENRPKDIHEKDLGFIHKSYEAAMYASEKLGWERITIYENGNLLSRKDIFEKIKAALAL